MKNKEKEMKKEVKKSKKVKAKDVPKNKKVATPKQRPQVDNTESKELTPEEIKKLPYWKRKKLGLTGKKSDSKDSSQNQKNDEKLITALGTIITLLEEMRSALGDAPVVKKNNSAVNADAKKGKTKVQKTTDDNDEDWDDDESLQENDSNDSTSDDDDWDL